MKILIYGLNFYPECVGIGKYSGDLAFWLASRGHKVRVIASQPYFPAWRVWSDYSNTYKYQCINNVQTVRCPLWVPSRPSGLTRLIHLASFVISSFPILLFHRCFKPHVIITIAPAFFCAPGALLLSFLCGSKTKSWLHIQDFELDAAFDLGFFSNNLLRRTAEYLESIILRGFNQTSSISHAMVRRLRSKSVQADRALLFPNWVDLDQIYPQIYLNGCSNCYRRKLGISDDAVVLMYSGSMNQKQGLDLVVEAIKLLANEPNVVWFLAGEGPSKSELVRSTDSFTNVFHFPLQPAQTMNDWLNAADIHLLPQKSAVADLVLPSKLLGILASGRPVVATSPSDSELAQLVKTAGICTEPGDSLAFAAALRSLISDPVERQLAGKRARQLVEDKFGKDTVLRLFEHQLSLLVQQGRW